MSKFLGLLFVTLSLGAIWLTFRIDDVWLDMITVGAAVINAVAARMLFLRD